MKNPITIEDDLIGREAAMAIKNDLKLRHVRVFNYRKAAHIVWSVFCLTAANVFFRQEATVLFGAGFTLLFVHSILGSPVHYELDKASQDRLNAWMDTQRPNAS
jgi:hypothetical protein